MDLKYYLALVFATSLVGCAIGKSATRFDTSNVASLELHDIDPSTKPHVFISDGRYVVPESDVHALFARSGKKRLTVWKGAMLGVARMKDGKEIRMAFSYSDAAVRMLDSGQTYYLDEVSARQYGKTLEAAFKAFGPARKAQMEKRKLGR